MTTFPNSPRLLKGAIVGFDAFNPLGCIAVFQYNPDMMMLRLESQPVCDERERLAYYRLTRSPKIAVSVEYRDRHCQSTGSNPSDGINLFSPFQNQLNHHPR